MSEGPEGETKTEASVVELNGIALDVCQTLLRGWTRVENEALRGLVDKIPDTPGVPFYQTP